MCLIVNCCLLKTTIGTHTETCKKKRQVTERSWAVNLFNAVKELGRYPKESKGKDDAGQKECKLAHNIRMARKKQLFTSSQETELDELRHIQRPTKKTLR